MRSPILKQCAGRGYNSPIKQINTQTKLKDVPGKIVEAGKNMLNKVANTTVGDAINTIGNAANFLAGPGTTAVVGTVKDFMSDNDTKPKPKKLMKKLERLPKKK